MNPGGSKRKHQSQRETPVATDSFSQHSAVFDSLRKSVLDHLVIFSVYRGDTQFLPAELTLDETNPCGVGFAFQAMQASFALESGFSSLFEGVLLGGRKGARGELLCGVAVDVVAQPRTTKSGGKGMEAVFQEAVVLVELAKGLGSLFALVEAACSTECFGLTKESETTKGLLETSIVELAGSFETGLKQFFVVGVGLQREFEYKRRCV